MDLRPLIRSTLRLTDLHDYSRGIGSPANLVSEARPGKEDGLWVDVAAKILGYIHKNEVVLSNEYIELAPCFSEIKTIHRQITDADLKQVVAVLSTPTESVMRNPQNAGQLDITKESTALLDRPPYESANKARLTRTGRHMIQLVASAQNFLLTEFKASEISRALSLGMFDQAIDALNNVMQRVAELAQDIRHAREQPGKEHLIEMFDKHSESYVEALRKTRIEVGKGRDMLQTEQVRESMDAYSEHHAGEKPDTVQFLGQIGESLALLERLNRVYSDFSDDVARRPEKPIGVRDMVTLATYLAFHPPEESVMEACHFQLGPLGVCFPHPSPTDFEGCLPAPKQAETNEVFEVARSDESVEEIRPMDLFLEAHQGKIRHLLEQRPILLSEANSQGWLSVKGELMVAELVSVFSSPHRLQESEHIAFRFISGALSLSLPDGKDLVGDDLELSLKRNPKTNPIEAKGDRYAVD